MYDDPDPVPHPIRQQKDTSYTGWAMGVLLVLLLMGAVFTFTRSDRINTASNTAPDLMHFRQSEQREKNLRACAVLQASHCSCSRSGLWFSLPSSTTTPS
jgi:hypothetical protein